MNDVSPTIPPRQARRGDRMFYPDASGLMVAATVSLVEPLGVWVNVVHVRPTAVSEREEIVGKPLSFPFLEATRSYARPMPSSAAHPVVTAPGARLKGACDDRRI